MKKLLYFTVSILISAVASGQVTQTTRSADTLPTAPPAERLAVPATGHRIDAVQRRSASEVNAEMESKQKTQAKANRKPNPHDRPLTEPASTRSGVNSSTQTPPASSTPTGTR